LSPGRCTNRDRLGPLAVALGCFPFDNGAYPPLSDCRAVHPGIRSLMEFGNPVRPLALSVLYPQDLTRDASPQTISGRTSYLQARLAFHPYPQVIQRFFNNDRFGPPHEFNHASACPWIDRLVSGLLPATVRPVQTRFRYGFVYRLNLAADSNSQAHYAKGTP